MRDFSAEHYPMDSFLVVVMDLPLLWQTFLSALFLFYAWNLTSVLHRVYHTQVILPLPHDLP